MVNSATLFSWEGAGDRLGSRGSRGGDHQPRQGVLSAGRSHEARPGQVLCRGRGGALRGIAGRPIVLKRYVDGAEGDPFFQKRAPAQHPDWIETVEVRFPSGRTAREVVVRDAAQLLWIVNLGCIDLNPHPYAPRT